MSGLQSYWRGLSMRERRVLGAGGVLTLLILFYALAWLPVQEQLDRLRPQVISKTTDLAWMQQQAEMVNALKQQSPGRAVGNSLPVLTVIDQTARGLNIRGQITQIQPGKQSGTAKVWFDKVIFEDWLKWLDAVGDKGISVSRVSITRSADAPRVNVRLEVGR